MNKVYLVWEDNNEDYEMHRITLLGVFPFDKLDEAKAMADASCTVRKGYSSERGKPAPYVGNTCYVELWDCIAQSSGNGDPVYSRSKYAEANKVKADVAAQVERDYEAEMALLRNAMERDKEQRLANRLVALGVAQAD